LPGKTSISWTNLSWGLFGGCSRISPECENCYAEILAATRLKHNKRYIGLAVIRGDGQAHWTNEFVFHGELLTWAAHKTIPAFVFTNSMSDPFHHKAKTAWIDSFFAAMLLGNQHIYQVLTKRAGAAARYLRNPETKQRVFDRARQIWNEDLGRRSRGKTLPFPTERLIWPAPHIWIGTSVGLQKTAEKVMDEFLTTPAGWFLWWSSEPLIGELIPKPEWFDGSRGNRIGWVVSGGESGKNSKRIRPMNPVWEARLEAFCARTETPYWYKQPGNWRAVCARLSGHTIRYDTMTHEGKYTAFNAAGKRTEFRYDGIAGNNPIFGPGTEDLTVYRWSGSKSEDSDRRAYPPLPSSFKPPASE
jgi:protein gp37